MREENPNKRPVSLPSGHSLSRAEQELQNARLQPLREINAKAPGKGQLRRDQTRALRVPTIRVNRGQKFRPHPNCVSALRQGTASAVPKTTQRASGFSR